MAGVMEDCVQYSGTDVPPGLPAPSLLQILPQSNING